jgi:integrase
MRSVGLRPNEARSPRKSNVGLERGILWPTDAKSKRDARLKKGVPLNSEVIDVLRAWMKETRSEWVFPAPRDPDRHMVYHVVARRFGESRQEAGAAPISLHKLRHTFGTRLAERNIPIQEIQELMGHRSINTTRIYVRPSLERKREAVESLVAVQSQMVRKIGEKKQRRMP